MRWTSRLLAESRGVLTMLALTAAVFIWVGYIRSFDPIFLILANLRLHLAAGLALLALLLLVTGARLRFVAALAGALGVMVQVFWLLSPLAVGAATDTGEPVRVISFNTLFDNDRNGAAIADFLADSPARIVALQEAGPLTGHTGRLYRTFPYHVDCTTPSGDCQLGLLSKTELHNVSIQRLTPFSPHPYIYAETEIGGTMVKIISLQLARPYDAETQIAEMQALAQHVADLDGPLIVMGDFNATPWQPWFADMLAQSGLRRVLIEPGTWPVPLGDWGEPIDHILVKGAGLKEVTGLVSAFGSNHRGLTGEVIIPKSGISPPVTATPSN